MARWGRKLTNSWMKNINFCINARCATVCVILVTFLQMQKNCECACRGYAHRTVSNMMLRRVGQSGVPRELTVVSVGWLHERSMFVGKNHQPKNEMRLLDYWWLLMVCRHVCIHFACLFCSSQGEVGTRNYEEEALSAHWTEVERLGKSDTLRDPVS